MDEGTLFDEPEGGAPCPDGAGESPARAPWSECPLAAFLAMSEAAQLDYCARRDEDTLLSCEPEDRAFFAERAAWYRARMGEL